MNELMQSDSWPQITDEDMLKLKELPHPYTLLILRKGPRFSMDPEGIQIIREHGRRNLRLRAAGLMVIICPVSDGGDVSGVGIFAADPDQVDKIMAGDPGVQAGLFKFEVHPTRIFPGDTIPPRSDPGPRSGFL